MKARDYILAKQVQWALNRGIELQGSNGDRGRPAYTPTLDDNLYKPLHDKVRERFQLADGSEIKESKESPAKMQAVHSSSALGVNIFQYWMKSDRVPLIAAACDFCPKSSRMSERIVFEDRYPIVEKKFGIPPNIDVVIHNSRRAKVRRFAIECKFSEAYTTRGHSGLKEKYLRLDEIWQDIPHIHRLAKSLCPEDTEFRYLHAAQLIKHILGLRKTFSKDGFKLLYLWYDVLGEEGAVHRKEVEDFSEVVRSDGVKFDALSYQELIVRLCDQYRSDHEEYIQYISERYL